MPPKLPAGHYYGEIQASRQVDGLFLSETVYEPECRVPKHSHTNSYLCLVRQGAYTETYGQRSRRCEPLSLVFHPPEEVHCEHFHDQPGLSFNVELDPKWLKRLEFQSDLFQKGFDFRGGELATLAMRLNHEFHTRDDASTLAIEGLTLELLAAVARKSRPAAKVRKVPPWLDRAWQLVHDRFHEPLTLADVAATVAVHPVHLATTFRRHYRCSLGEALRRRRIEHASQQLALSEASMAEIARACGFADQSHFCNTFKRQVGMTPSTYRRTCQSR
jgi:AraC family transcriptional regulator